MMEDPYIETAVRLVQKNENCIFFGRIASVAFHLRRWYLRQVIELTEVNGREPYRLKSAVTWARGLK
jgi:hypothetical protein